MPSITPLFSEFSSPPRGKSIIHPSAAILFLASLLLLAVAGYVALSFSERQSSQGHRQIRPMPAIGYQGEVLDAPLQPFEKPLQPEIVRETIEQRAKRIIARLDAILQEANDAN